MTNLSRFLSTSGREVHFESFAIHLSLLGWLEGDKLLFKDVLLEKLPATVERKFGRTGLLLKEPPPGFLPKYICYATFHCFEPIKESHDSSSLTIVWFSDTIPSDINLELRTQFQDIDWEKHAKDGII